MNWYRIVVIGWLLTSASCGMFGDEQDEEQAQPAAATAPRLVGRIASINEPMRFVLIEGYGEWQLGEGLLLSSFGGENERSGSLIASGERMGRFAAADWKSGELEVGDQVYARPLKEHVDPLEVGDFSKIEENGGPEGNNFEKNGSGTD